MKISGELVTYLALISAVIPWVIQVAKKRGRVIHNMMPGGKVKSFTGWWLKSWGPVVATLLLWTATTVTAILPLIADGNLTAVEVIMIIGGGTVVSNVIHKASKLAR